MAKNRLAAFFKGEKKTFGQVDKSVAEATKKVSTKPELKKAQLPAREKIEVLPEYLEVKELLSESSNDPCYWGSWNWKKHFHPMAR